MKEATGELNMTVVTVVAIAAIGAFFYAFVWPAIQNSIKNNTCNVQCGDKSDPNYDQCMADCKDEQEASGEAANN